MRYLLLKIAPLLLLGGHFAAAQITSTFDHAESTEGGTTSFFSASGPFTTPISTGGLALSHGTNGNNRLDIAYYGGSLLYFEAPAKFLGDDSFAYQKSLSFDVGDNGSSTTVNGPDVILVGKNITLVLDIATNPPTNSNLTLGHFEVSLMPSSAWHISTLTGATPTTAQFRSVLSSLTALRIRGSFHQSAVASIDNISIVPEPSTVILLMAALVFCGLCSARRIRRAPISS
jgi:hypothetical protein